MRAPSLLLLQHALAGAAGNADLDAWMRGAFRTWLHSAGVVPLHRCFGLPSARRIPVALRDFWLAAAAMELGLRPGNLQKASIVFEATTWPAWQHLETAPSSATPAQAYLFLARKASAFPSSQRQFTNIIDAALGKRKPENTSMMHDRRVRDASQSRHLKEKEPTQ